MIISTIMGFMNQAMQKQQHEASMRKADEMKKQQEEQNKKFSEELKKQTDEMRKERDALLKQLGIDPAQKGNANGNRVHRSAADSCAGHGASGGARNAASGCAVQASNGNNGNASQATGNSDGKRSFTVNFTMDEKSFNEFKKNLPNNTASGMRYH